MDFLVTAGQLILSLSILIVLHECGHFFPARFFNTRVEKFYLFFDPWFSLFKKKVGETEYGIGWLPLGGYVKISGMIDESMDREQMKQEPQPWEFRSKPAWQRLIIMLGGVTVNFILGFLIYGMVFWVWGQEYLPTENAPYGIYADSLGMELGLEHGDKILSINEVPFDRFNPGIVIREIVINGADEMKVERDGQEVAITIDNDKWTKILSSSTGDKNLFYARHPTIVNQVVEGKAADLAGIKVGDKLTSVNGTTAIYFQEFKRELAKYAPAQAMESPSLLERFFGKEEAPQETVTVDIGVQRGNDAFELPVELSPNGRIWIAVEMLETETETFGFGEAMVKGTKEGWNFLVVQIKAFGKMFSGKINASDSLGGFGSIGSMFGSFWNWQNFWRMTAILSLILAFMNLLPIPALDGGHVMFLLYEIVTGRKPSDRFMEIATMIGFVLLISLVLYANGLDVFRWLRG
ncbi:MAG: site-2 protease family protein [Bacteroidota bacterium]